jgi:hypothetical protein
VQEPRPSRRRRRVAQCRNARGGRGRSRARAVNPQAGCIGYSSTSRGTKRRLPADALRAEIASVRCHRPAEHRLFGAVLRVEARSVVPRASLLGGPQRAGSGYSCQRDPAARPPARGRRSVLSAWQPPPEGALCERPQRSRPRRLGRAVSSPRGATLWASDLLILVPERAMAPSPTNPRARV